MNEMETVIFGMISQVGSARSSYLEGLRAAVKAISRKQKQNYKKVAKLLQMGTTSIIS